MAQNELETFYWHDYETWGANPLVDRPAQFAGLRTDTDFNVVGRPLTLYVQPTPDFLPNPEATLVTGITQQSHCPRVSTAQHHHYWLQQYSF